MTLTVGSLFSGIGGLDLGLERAGMRVVWQSEIDPYASRVLAKHWPNVPNLGDIKTIDWSTVERPDLICGGYPCQPFSFAGGRAGTGDPRHLWPWMRDSIRLLRPRWALLENVPGHLGLGFDSVLADLASLGFDAEWELLPAAAVGAPHLRYRLFVVAAGSSSEDVADANGRRRAQRGEPNSGPECGQPASRRDDTDRRDSHMADAERPRRAGQIDTQPGRSPRPMDAEGHSVLGGRCKPDRRPWWDVEPDVGRVANGVPARVDRLRCLGNAVVPQVAEWIGRRIVEAAA